MNRRVYGNAANWPGGPNSETYFLTLLTLQLDLEKPGASVKHSREHVR